MLTWTEQDYDRLFAAQPPTQPYAPSAAEVSELAAALGCTEGAARAQWNGGRSAVLGSKTAASRRLIDYLRRRGWLN